MISDDFSYFWIFFAPENQNFLILFGFKFSACGEMLAFYWLIWIFSRQFSALWKVRKISTQWMFDAMGNHLCEFHNILTKDSQFLFRLKKISALLRAVCVLSLYLELLLDAFVTIRYLKYWFHSGAHLNKGLEDARACKLLKFDWLILIQLKFFLIFRTWEERETGIRSNRQIGKRSNEIRSKGNHLENKI